MPTAFESVDRTRRAGRVQSSENDVPCFRRRNSGFDGFQVSHFTDENDVRVLTQGAANGFRKRRNVDADFTLVDCTFDVVVIEFDRVFNRNDVTVNRFVQMLDHGGQRCRFTGTGRPGNENHASRTQNQFCNNRRGVEVFERHQLNGNLSQNHRDAASLLEYGNTETRLVAEGETEVRTADFLKFLLAAFRRDAFHQGDGVVRFQNLCFQTRQRAVKTNYRRLTNGDVQVGRAFVDYYL